MSTPIHQSPSPAAISDAPGGATAPGRCAAVVGLQWGDEGKGKIVDLLAPQHAAVVRYNGGANAGHSVVVRGERYALHLVPSGILYPGKRAVIGNGVVVDPWKLVEELDGLAQRGIDTRGLVVSDRAHVVLPYHKIEDGLREDRLNQASQGGAAQSTIGTTRRGIGPAYADKCHRGGAIRVRDLLREDALRERLGLALSIKRPALVGLGLRDDADMADLSFTPLLAKCLAVGQRLRPMVADTTQMLHQMLRQGDNILFEGANGTLLDVDHGTYPYVTGSTCVASGVGPGTGVPAARLSRVVGVMKAYTTRVGGGPMPTELFDETGQRIRDRGREYGTTTGRPRRVGWLDLVALRYSVMINGVTHLALTMLDVLGGFDQVHAAVAYEIDGQRVEHFPPDAIDLARAKPIFKTLPGYPEITSAGARSALPDNARRYVAFLEEQLGVPAAIISVGPGREQTIVEL